MTAKISVRVQPKARRNEIAGVEGGVVKVRVTAPPEDGRANRAVAELLAQRLGTPVRDIRIVKGLGSRLKVIAIEGVAEDAALEALGQPG